MFRFQRSIFIRFNSIHRIPIQHFIRRKNDSAKYVDPDDDPLNRVTIISSNPNKLEAAGKMIHIGEIMREINEKETRRVAQLNKFLVEMRDEVIQNEYRNIHILTRGKFWIRNNLLYLVFFFILFFSLFLHLLLALAKPSFCFSCFFFIVSVKTDILKRKIEARLSYELAANVYVGKISKWTVPFPLFIVSWIH